MRAHAVHRTRTMHLPFSMRDVACLSLTLLVACGGDDGGSSPSDAAGSDAARGSDSGSDGRFDTCDGACKVTALIATFGASSRTLDHAFYGVSTGMPTTLYVEVDSGLTVCPEMSSPTPKYSLILGTLVVPTDRTASSSPGNLLDYVGDLIPQPASGPPRLGEKATTVTLTPTAAKSVLDAAGFIAFDANLVFPDGTITGHFYAQHCASLDSADGT